MPEEIKKLKSSLKKTEKTKPERVESTRSLGRFDDPSTITAAEQTCNFENFWRALFCFDGPLLPDAELPRNFKEFKTDSSTRLNSFTLASSRSDEMLLTEFHGAGHNVAPKKVEEDPEVVARKKKDMDELRSVLSHNTEERLKEQSIDEDLLDAQRRAAEEEEMRAIRKQQLLEMRQFSQSYDGTRPRGFSASLPPQSPRVNVPLPARQSPSHGTAAGVNVGIASGSGSAQSTPRRADFPEIPLAGPAIRSTFSHSTSSTSYGGGAPVIPRSARAVPHSPYHTTVAASQFSQLSPATTGDSVDGVDLSNFTRFASSDGVSCCFYLPSREGDAKAKPARFHVDLQSTKFRLDILAASSSPASPLHSGAEVVVKSLTFDTAHDITALTKGRGPVVRMPPDVPEELLLHITLYNKPEINLSFADPTSRNVVYNALPKMLATSAANKHPHNHIAATHSNDLISLSHSVTKVTSYYWVEVPTKSFVAAGKSSSRLLITLSDDTLVVYTVAREYASVVSSGGSTPSAASATAAAARVEEVESKRRTLNEQLNVFTQSRWNPDGLPDGFDVIVVIAFSEIKKVSHVGETDQDHIIEIFYQKEKKEESALLVRVDAATKRKALIVFLEDKRKSCKKQSQHHELL